MDERSAKEYVVALITTIKNTRTKRKKLENEIETWKNRVKLARENGRSDLEAQAVQRVGEKEQELDAIKTEEREFIRELHSAKAQLKTIQNQPSLSINPDLLLAELEMVVGEHDETGEKFREFEAEQALNDLKKQLDSEGDE
jgi:hypothetical protein